MTLSIDAMNHFSLLSLAAYLDTIEKQKSDDKIPAVTIPILRTDDAWRAAHKHDTKPVQPADPETPLSLGIHPRHRQPIGCSPLS